eukprot:IDg2440t1
MLGFSDVSASPVRLVLHGASSHRVADSSRLSPFASPDSRPYNPSLHIRPEPFTATETFTFFVSSFR